MRVFVHSFVFALACASMSCSPKSESSPPTSSAGSTAPNTTPPGAGAAAPNRTTPPTMGTATPGISTGNSAACPALRPVESSACMPMAVPSCSYDEIECSCSAGSWTCAEPVDPNCPAMMPVHGSVCSVPDGTECEFLADECECKAGRWSCESFEQEDAGVSTPVTPSDAGVSVPPAQDAGSVDAGINTPCPDLRPVEGRSCTVALRYCTYDTTTCSCPQGSWLCNESVDPNCPPEPPQAGSQCTGRADCDYFSLECECRSGSWTCKPND